jgi:hypothetical protein
LGLVVEDFGAVVDDDGTEVGVVVPDDSAFAWATSCTAAL